MAAEAIEFRDYMSQLDGNQHDDMSLLNLLHYQCDRVFKESGSPVAVEICDRSAVLYENGVWGRAPFHEMHVYAKVRGEFYRYDFATRPIYEQGFDQSGYPITSEYQAVKFPSREAMQNYRNVTWAFTVAASDRATRTNYGRGAGDAELIIDGFYNLWSWNWLEKVRTEETL